MTLNVSLSPHLASIDEEAIALTMAMTHVDAESGGICVVRLVEPISAGTVGRWSDTEIRDRLRRCLDRSVRRLYTEASRAGLSDPTAICSEILGNPSEVGLSLEFTHTISDDADAALPKKTQLVATIQWRKESLLIPKVVKHMCASLWNGRWLNNVPKRCDAEDAASLSLKKMLPPPGAGTIGGPNAFEAYRVTDPYGGMVLNNVIVAGVDERYAYLAINVLQPPQEGEESPAHVIHSTLGIVGKVPVPALFHTSLSSNKVGSKRGREEETDTVGFGDDCIEEDGGAAKPVHAWYAEFSRANSKGCGFKFKGRYDSDDSVPQHIRYINECVRPKKQSEARQVRWLNGSRYAVAMQRHLALPNATCVCHASVIKVFADRTHVACELEDVNIVSLDAEKCTETTLTTNEDIESALLKSLQRIAKRVRKYQQGIAASTAALSQVDATTTAVSLAEGSSPIVDGEQQPSSEVAKCAAKVLADFLNGGGDETSESVSAGVAKIAEVDAARVHVLGERMKDSRSATFTAWTVPEYRSRLSVFTLIEKVFRDTLFVDGGNVIALSATSVQRLQKTSAKANGIDALQSVLRGHVVDFTNTTAPLLPLEEGTCLEFKHHLSAGGAPGRSRAPLSGGGQHQADAERIRHTISAMASSAFGGILVVGVSDDGKITGHPSGEVKNALRLGGFAPALPKDAVIVREVALINAKPSSTPAAASSAPTDTPAASVLPDMFSSSPLARLFSGLQQTKAPSSSSMSSSSAKAAPAGPPLVITIVSVRPCPAPYYLPTSHGYAPQGPSGPTTGKIPPPVLPVVRGSAGNRAVPAVAAVATMAAFVARQQN